MKQIDTRGLSCPEPLVLASKEIRNGKEDFEVLTNSPVALENITQELDKSKLKYSKRNDGNTTIIAVTR